MSSLIIKYSLNTSTSNYSLSEDLSLPSSEHRSIILLSVLKKLTPKACMPISQVLGWNLFCGAVYLKKLPDFSHVPILPNLCSLKAKTTVSILRLTLDWKIIVYVWNLEKRKDALALTIKPIKRVIYGCLVGNLLHVLRKLQALTDKFLLLYQYLSSSSRYNSQIFVISFPCILFPCLGTRWGVSNV